MDCSIIIVNYNTKVITNNCIDSIISKTKDVEYEIILVDNGSTDGSKEYFEQRKDIKFIYSKENIGFGRANNLGSQYAKGEFLFLLNSDMLFIENSIKKFLEFYLTWEQKLKIGVLGCRLIDVNGNTNNSGGGFPWVKNDLKEIYIMIAEKLLKRKFPPRDYYDFSKRFFEIDYVIGADMFMRKSLFDSNNGFDQAYFMYYEESDLQMKIRKQGYNNYIFTETSIIHFEGASSTVNLKNKMSNKKRIINTISRNYYFKKNDSKNYPLHIITDFILSIRRIFNNEYTLKDNWQYFIENFKSY